MTSPPKRRWFAFRLRTLLIVVVVLGCVLTPLRGLLKKAREQKKVVAWVLENGGEVEYDWESGPKWFQNLVGKVRLVGVGEQVRNLSPLEGLADIQVLILWHTRVSDLSPVQELTTLQYLFPQNTNVSDLSPLKGLTNLQDLRLVGTKVTAEEVKRLQKALPNCWIRTR